MNPTEIYEALANLASKPFDAAEFPFEFALATDNALRDDREAQGRHLQQVRHS